MSDGSSKSSDTLIAPTKEEVMNTLYKCSSNMAIADGELNSPCLAIKVVPPSKSRRDKGKGSGWIECKPIKRSGKE